MYQTILRNRVVQFTTLSNKNLFFNTSVVQATTRMASTTTSTSTTTTKEWLCHIPDHAGALAKRLEVRPTHLENLKPSIEAGQVLFGGAVLSRHPTTQDETPDMTGSMMLVKAESEEAVMEMIRNDPYTKGGVWDAENVKIWPFRTAVRTAL